MQSSSSTPLASEIPKKTNTLVKLRNTFDNTIYKIPVEVVRCYACWAAQYDRWTSSSDPIIECNETPTMLVALIELARYRAVQEQLSAGAIIEAAKRNMVQPSPIDTDPICTSYKIIDCNGNKYKSGCDNSKNITSTENSRYFEVDGGRAPYVYCVKTYYIIGFSYGGKSSASFTIVVNVTKTSLVVDLKKNHEYTVTVAADGQVSVDKKSPPPISSKRPSYHWNDW